METHPLPDAPDFGLLSLLCLNANGRFVRPRKDRDSFSDGEEVLPDQLPGYLKERVVLPEGVTDVFVWVHGWRNDHVTALANARRLFHGIIAVHQARPMSYPRLAPFVPAFLLVRWPSTSWPTAGGYRTIRDRAAALTEQGDAEFFLASLLGYLDQKNTRMGGLGSKTLMARGGFYVHCVGHSFGGRFLTAAICAAAHPQARTLSLLADLHGDQRKVLAAHTPARFEFTVDSALVFQMAAPRTKFAPRLSTLVHEAPFRGPLVVTHSTHDKANGRWHQRMEGEPAIGYSGAGEPSNDIAGMQLGDGSHVYPPQDFASRIVNVQCSEAFRKGGFCEGAHSDFWYEESIHLLLSLVNHARQ